MTIFERLMFLAKGGRVDYLHRTKENKKVTKLQDFLSEVMERQQLEA
jgi:hypothetical protein